MHWVIWVKHLMTIPAMVLVVRVVDVLATHASQKTGQIFATLGRLHRPLAPPVLVQNGTSSALPLQPHLVHLPPVAAQARQPSSAAASLLQHLPPRHAPVVHAASASLLVFTCAQDLPIPIPQSQLPKAFVHAEHWQHVSNPRCPTTTPPGQRASELYRLSVQNMGEPNAQHRPHPITK